MDGKHGNYHYAGVYKNTQCVRNTQGHYAKNVPYFITFSKRIRQKLDQEETLNKSGNRPRMSVGHKPKYYKTCLRDPNWSKKPVSIN